MLHTMIMAGGGGTRFWPRSRSARPKQFLSFEGDRTLLQATFDRAEALVAPERFWVITSGAHRDQAVAEVDDFRMNVVSFVDQMCNKLTYESISGFLLQ